MNEIPQIKERQVFLSAITKDGEIIFHSLVGGVALAQQLALLEAMDDVPLIRVSTSRVIDNVTTVVYVTKHKQLATLYLNGLFLLPFKEVDKLATVFQPESSSTEDMIYNFVVHI